MKPYVIQQGDHLAKLAFQMGFDADAIWNDPSNAALREKRKPNLLHPGDVLQVPDTTSTGMTLRAGAKNSYAATVPQLPVHLVFTDEDGPIKDEPYEVRGFAAPAAKTDGNGGVTLSVPVNVREFQLHFTKRNMFYPVFVGDMDPVEEDSGVDKRLQHLGYLRPPYVDLKSQREDALRSFQAVHGLPRTGVADDATRAALVKENGS